MSQRNPFTTPPVEQPTNRKPAQLTREQISHFFQKGWVLLPDFIDYDVLENVKKGISKQVDILVDKLFNAGKISNKYADVGFFQRMIHIEKEFPGSNILLHTLGILPEGAKELWSYPKLLNVAEQLIGPEIAGHPIWNIRVKLPEHEDGVVPWHQDNGYLNDDSLNTMILTAWIPLLDTNENNGGMAMLDKTHADRVLAQHFCCTGNTHYIEIEEEEIERAFRCKVESETICNVDYGGVLLFSNMIVHRSCHNRSNDIRWSMDLRWQDPRQPNGRDEGNEIMPVMRSRFKDIEEIDWSVMVNRQIIDYKKDDEFDARIIGPWMKRWPIKKHNHHTEKFMKTQM